MRGQMPDIFSSPEFAGKINPNSLPYLLKSSIIMVKHIKILFKQGAGSPAETVNQLSDREAVPCTQLQAADKEKRNKANKEMRLDMITDTEKDRPCLKVSFGNPEAFLNLP